MPRRRIVGRPLLIATAGVAALAYACGSQVAGNLAVPVDAPAGDVGQDMNVSEVSGNLSVPVDAGNDEKVPGDASSDGD